MRHPADLTPSVTAQKQKKLPVYDIWMKVKSFFFVSPSSLLNAYCMQVGILFCHNKYIQGVQVTVHHLKKAFTSTNNDNKI